MNKMPLIKKTGQRLLSLIISQVLVILMVLSTFFATTQTALGATAKDSSPTFYVSGSTQARSYCTRVTAEKGESTSSYLKFRVEYAGMANHHNFDIESSDSFRYETDAACSIDGGSFRLLNDPVGYYSWSYRKNGCNESNFNCGHYKYGVHTYIIDRQHSSTTVQFRSITQNSQPMNYYNSSGKKGSGTINRIARATTGDLTVAGHSQYTITYDANGGSGSVPNVQTYCADTSCSYSDSTIKSGSGLYRNNYEFAGWNTSPSGYGTACYAGNELPSSLNGSNVTLYAQWEYSPSEYSVWYDGNGADGGVPSTQTKTAGTTLYLSYQRPYKNTDYGVSRPVAAYLDPQGGSVNQTTLYTNKNREYTFDGWRDDYGSWYNAGSAYTRDEDTTMTAEWSENYTYDSVTLPTPTHPKREFEGWYTSPTGGTKVTSPYTPTSNSATTLYAHWGAEKYTVSYDMNGGYGGPSAQTKTEGQSMKISSTVPSKSSISEDGFKVTLNPQEGSVNKTSITATKTKVWTFDKWLYNGTYYSPGDYFTEDTDAILKATWKSSYTYGSVTLPTPTRNGYNFDGWYTASSGGNKVSSTYTPNSDIALYAHWSPVGYSVKYDGNGGSGAPSAQTKYHDISLTLSSTRPTKANTTRTGYKVTFNANGGSVSPSSATSTITTSYTFGSWNTNSNGSGKTYAAGSTYTENNGNTLYAQWNSRDRYGSITLPTPTSEGNKFRGWYTSPTGGTKINATTYEPTKNIELYAHWSPNIVFKKISGNTSISGIELKRIAANSDGTAKFTTNLKHDQNFKILSLDEGAKYKITEQGTKLYIPSYKTLAENTIKKSAVGESGESLSTPIAVIGKNAKYSFINEKTKLVGYELSIKKALAGDLITDTDKNKEFTFKYEIRGLNPDIEYPIWLPGAAVSEDSKDFNESLVTTAKPTTTASPGSFLYNKSGVITGTFKMKAGGDSIKNSYRIKGLPKGATFWVEEVTKTSSSQTFDYKVNYEVTGGVDSTKKDADNGEKQISTNEYGLRSTTEEINDESIEYTFTNIKTDYHKLTLSKSLKIDGADKPSTNKYEFEFSATGLEPNKTYSSTDGSISFKTDETGSIIKDGNNNLENSIKIELQVGKPIVFDKLPGTMKFKLAEKSNSAVPHFILKDQKTGKVIKESEGKCNEDSYFGVSKDYIFNSDQIINITNNANTSSSLYINKTIEGSGSNKNDIFKANVSFKNLEPETSYDIIGLDNIKSFTSNKNGECNLTFNLTNESKIIFENLPSSTLYKITEEANDKGYTPSYSANSNGGVSIYNNVGEEGKALSTPWENLLTKTTFDFVNTKDVASPTKTVSDKDDIKLKGTGPEINVKENTVESRNSTWTYTIKQEVPKNSSDLTVTDYLPPYIETILHNNPEVNKVHAIFHKNNGTKIEGSVVKSGDVYKNDAFELSYDSTSLRGEVTAKLIDKNLLQEGGTVELTFDVFLPSNVTIKDLEKDGCVSDDGTRLIFKNIADTDVSGNLLSTNETITNIPLLTGLTVKKNVVGKLGDRNKDFKFTASFTGLTPNEEFSINRPETIIVDANYDNKTSSIVFTAKGLKDKTPKKDVSISVYKNDEDMTNLGSVKTNDSGIGSMQLSTGNYVAKSGSTMQEFVVESVMNESNTGMELKVISYEKLKLPGKGSESTFSANDKGNATVNFTLKADEMAIFDNLTPGSTYNVTEAADTQYTSSYEVLNGKDTVLSPSGANTSNNKSLATGINNLKSERPVVIQFNNTVNTKDIKISKVAFGSKDELPGATLSLRDADGKVIESWKTGSSPKSLTVAYDTEYSITEDSAPNGYNVAEPIKFRINLSGEVEIKTGNSWVTQAKDTITIVDKYKEFEIEIEKRDYNTTDLLSGAKLALKKKDGTLIKEWITNASTQKFNLTMGDYILSEVTAPSGYKKASDIAFKVNEEGKVTASALGTNGALNGAIITMYDVTETKNVILKKVVKGDLGDLESDFGFTAEFTGLNRSATYKFGNSSFKTDAYGKASITFAMRANDVYTFELPVGATYAFTENASTHKATFEVTSNNRTSVIAKASASNTEMNKSLSTAVEKVDATDGDVTIKYTNTRNMASVTGVNDSTDKLIYGVALTLLIISSFFIIRKRRKTTE